jgi:integrase
MRGHIEQRSAGSWTVQVSGGFSETTGRRVRVTRTVKGSRRDAERELTRALRDVDQGLVAEPGRATLRSYLEERWLPHAGTRVRPATHERYCSLMRRHVEPRIGRIRLAKLRPVHVQAVLDGIIADELSPRTAEQCYRVLSAALKQAVKWQALAVNPALAVSPPRPDRPELVVPDAAAVRQILEGAEDPLRIALLLAASTGMRRGEVLGLRWSGVDLDAARVHVNSSLQRVGGELVFVAPKTDRSRRTIALPRITVDALRRWRKDQAERRLLLGEAWHDAGVVVDRGDGRPLDPAELSHGFARLCARNGLAGVRLHDLRHAFATQLLVAGVHPKVVSDALGHASTAFTMDVYSHVLPSMGDQVADAMQAALAATGSKSGSKA